MGMLRLVQTFRHEPRPKKRVRKAKVKIRVRCPLCLQRTGNVRKMSRFALVKMLTRAEVQHAEKFNPCLRCGADTWELEDPEYYKRVLHFIWDLRNSRDWMKKRKARI